MAANLSRKVKTPSGSQDEWTVRERLILGSSVVRSGDQNWVSVSRTVKPIADSAFGIRPRPSEFFSQKSCAAQYAEMLEKVATPKRKRTNEGGGTETPGEQIVRALTFERIDELRKQIKSDQLKYKRLKAEIEAILSGKCDDRLPGILESLQSRTKPPAAEPPVFNPPMQSQPLSNQPVTPSPATTPQQTSPQKQKNLRIPKPTERFQKYQQQQQARHSHTATQQQQHLQQQQQQLQQLHQQLAADTVPMQVEKTSEPSSKDLPRQFFRADSQSDGLKQQKTPQQSIPQPAVHKTLHRQKTPVTDSSQSLLAQLVGKASASVDHGAPAIPSVGATAAVNVDAAMVVDVTYEKQSTNVANVKSNVDSSKVLSNILEQGNASHGPAPVSSSGLLPTLLTTPVKEIKHVAETISQNSVVDHDQNETRPNEVSPETTVPFLDGGNLATDVVPKVESVREKKNAVVPASESAPTLSKLLATTAAGTDNKSTSFGETHSFAQKGDVSVSNEENIQVVTDVSSATSEVAPVSNKEETVQPSEELTMKDLPDKDHSPVLTKSSPVDETAAMSNKTKPEKRRPGRPRTRKLPKEMEAVVDNEPEEPIKEVIKPDLHLKIEPVDQIRASCVGGKERFKKVVDDLEEFRKEDKFEQSNQSSIYGSESVPDSPASQVSQSGSDDMDSVQAQKNWKKSIMLVWRAAANHKYANVFLHPVTDDEAPGYHNVIYRPMDLSTVKKNIENGATRTTSEFQRDMMLMFQNALMYNSSDHDVYRMAEEMREDVMEQIQSYIATQLMVQSDRESKMLRGHKTDVFHFSL